MLRHDAPAGDGGTYLSEAGQCTSSGLMVIRDGVVVDINFIRVQGLLRPGDRVDRTVGCRQSQPNNCGRNSLPTVCAFARADGICLAPPSSWKRRYAVLSQQAKARR